ncbi:MAG TPA: ABC transporter substrate-binding protein, partial [Candidatus Avipropionibacterium avicola]|nr:ABC transporter substrate-binding protein [Candidatus Avipropionibacterium avicola]
MERLLNRRTLLGATAAVSAVGLAGCRTKADSDQNRKVAEQNAQALLPTYRPVELAEPDLPGVDLLPPGYFTYPRN